jgi:outer membrane protein, heavy metal efflux system
MSRLFPSRNTTARSYVVPCLGLAAVVFFLAPGAARAQTQRAPEVELTLRVCRSGPGASTARAERGVGASELGAIEPLQNPSLVIEHQQTLSGPSERETVIGAEIPLVLSGRRGLLRDAARARQRVSDARASADLLGTALDFRTAFALAVVEQERAAVMQEQQKALEELSTALQQLTARGEAAAYDVRRHQAEVRLHARSLAAARARAQTAQRRLAHWLDEPTDAALLTSAGLAQAPVTPNQKNQHPEVTALRGTAQAASFESDAARRRWLPEPEIFAGYRQVAAGDVTGHGVALGLKLPLTFFEHGQGASTKARAEQRLAEARADRLERELDRELGAASASLQALEAALQQAQQNVAETAKLKESARILYGAGEASITELLDAYRTGESAALDRLTALEELLAARLAVMRAAGKQFVPELDASCGSQGNAVR